MSHVDPLTRRLVRSWAAREPEREPVFSALATPLASCRVALLSTAGLALRDDRPFDQAGEERNPWWGDPSHRVIPRGTPGSALQCYHLHIDPRPIEEDLNCALPLERLEELAAAGVIGEVADAHYSIMGYLLDTAELERETVPQIAESMRAEGVEVALLVPV